MQKNYEFLKNEAISLILIHSYLSIVKKSNNDSTTFDKEFYEQDAEEEIAVRLKLD